jgi:hypothetical protein
VSFGSITLCVASHPEFLVVYFVMYSVRKLLDTPSYMAPAFPIVEPELLMTISNTGSGS